MKLYTGNKLNLIRKLLESHGRYLNPITGDKQKLQFNTFKDVLNNTSEIEVKHAIDCIINNEWDQSNLLMNPLVWR